MGKEFSCCEEKSNFYDGSWETVYRLGETGTLRLPGEIARYYQWGQEERLAVGKVFPQFVELLPGIPGPVSVERGVLRVPLSIWARTEMMPGVSWVALLPFRDGLFLLDRGMW